MRLICPSTLLHDVHLLHLALVEDFARRRVLDFTRLDGSDILADIQQPCLAVDTTIRQHDRIAFNVTLRVVRIGHLAR